MRQALLLLLLAGAATPALAAADDQQPDSVPGAIRAEPSESSDGNGRRALRVQRAMPVERARAPQDGDRPAVRVESEQSPPVVERRGRDLGAGGSSDSAGNSASSSPAIRGGRGERAGFGRAMVGSSGPGQIEPLVRERRAGDTVRDWRRAERQRPDSPSAIEERNLRTGAVIDAADPPVQSIEERNLRRPGRVETAADGPLIRTVPSTGGISGRRIRRIGNTVPTRGVEAPAPATARTEAASPSRVWTTHWRNDRRYDWRDWRRRHRSRFHIGFYYDPFGWDYYRYGIGWRMWPSYYSSRYWLHDPWYYRLPPAYGPYRWIRYHDDALLVNIYTGHVVDVIHNFFW